ncbi:hypothetical protein AOLI_G00082710 [Acnodon oligacanthus]
MAQGAEVLSDQKCLRADFGVKLDNMTRRLTDMAKSMAALESKMAEVKGDVAANTARIDEAERRVGDAEDVLEAFQEKEYRETRRQGITHEEAKITFVQDLSAETVRVRRSFNAVTKLFVGINAFRGFQHNPCKLRVLHNGKMHLFSTPREAEEFYRSISQPE